MIFYYHINIFIKIKLKYMETDKLKFNQKLLIILFLRYTFILKIICIFSFIDFIKNYVQNHPMLLYIAIISAFVLFIIFYLYELLYYDIIKYDITYFIIILFTICESYSLGVLVSLFDPNIFIFYFLILILVILGLIIIQTKIEISLSNAILIICINILILYGIILSFFCLESICYNTNINHSVIAALIFSIYIVIYIWEYA